MDPNETLRMCRRLARHLIEQADAGRQHHETTTSDTAGEELAECFTNLDEWLSKGGFLPRDWSRS